MNLNNILHFSTEELRRTKIKFNVESRDHHHPTDVYLEDPQTINVDWLFSREEKHYFSVGEYAICLIRMDGDSDRWLLTTIKEVTERYDDIRHGTAYDGVELTRSSEFFGRAIVQYHNQSMNICRRAEGLIDELVVLEILAVPYGAEGR